MRRALAMVLALAACGHGATPPPAVPPPGLPRLLPPAPIDPKARGATYLTSVALQLQPGWGQFLDDCRLRLAPTDPLNRMTLAATADLAIDRAGRLVEERVSSSGNPDFDRAVHDAIVDATPFAPPAAELLSDDDRVHLRWLFARDRRQAGPATAELVTVELPLRAVIARRIAAGELAQAARRIAGSPAGADRDVATERLMIAILREALGSADGSSRRAAVEAIGRARVAELAGDVRVLLEVTSDTELRLAATATAAALGDLEAAHTLVEQLPADLPDHPRLALAETRALVDLGHTADAAAAIDALLERDGAKPHATAVQALAIAPVPELATRLAGWFRHGDARTRAAVCAALAGGQPAWPEILRGLGDPDATVRGTCCDAARAHGSPPAAAVARIRELARDRDQAVRTHALAALAALAPGHLVHAVDDPAAEVRAAYAAGLATAQPASAAAELRVLIDDRDPDVRAAAWTSLAQLPTVIADRAALAAHAATDPAAQVRRAALAAVDDDDALARLASADDSPEVRTGALVQLASRRGRAASADLLLDRLARAPAGSAERVRSALAWLLAR